MTIIGGKSLNNILAQNPFQKKRVEDEKGVRLKDEEGFIRIGLPNEHLNTFFEKAKEV